MSYRFYILYVLVFITGTVIAQQNEPVVIKINNKPVYKSEFERAYNKSIEKQNGGKTALDDFLKAYINFKLNIEEAKAEKLDTTAAYRRGYSSFKLQLSRQYVKDTVQTSSFLHKIYKRTLEDVELKHVLLPFEKTDLLPSDTLAAYNKALALRNTLLKNGFAGEDFIDNTTDINIVKDIESQKGYLGWISPFMLSLPVEDAAYNLPVQEISMPIRSQKGYHIIQVLSRRPAIGTYIIDQVLFNFPDVPATTQQVDSVRNLVWDVYNNQIKSTDNYDLLCSAYAEAMETGDRGCYFGPVRLSTVSPANFKKAVFNLLNEGDVSPPTETALGFHILRLRLKKAIPGLSEAKESLMKKIIAGDRVVAYNREHINRFFTNYGLSVNEEAYAKLNQIANIYQPSDSSFIMQIQNPDEILLSVDGKTDYFVKDFIGFLQSEIQTKNKAAEDGPQMIVMKEKAAYNLSTDRFYRFFEQFASAAVSYYAESTIEERYPELRKSIEDYAEGLLLFDVKNKNIWQKASKDEEGLAKYFERNKQKYTWNEPHFKGLIVYCKSEAILKEAQAIAAKKKNLDETSLLIRKTLNKNAVLTQIQSGIWLEGENAFVDNQIFKKENSPSHRNFPYFFVTGEFISSPEDFNDVRSLVEADYQEVLEKKWESYLHARYNIEINKSVLKKIK